MSQIMITCLRTGQVVSTGMVTDQPTWMKLAADWQGVAFLCPACDTMHEWIKRDASLKPVSGVNEGPAPAMPWLNEGEGTGSKEKALQRSGGA